MAWKTYQKWFITSFFAVTMAQAVQASQNCLSQFYADAPPYLSKESLQKNTTALCLHGFNVMYSGLSKTPLWSAEYLTTQRLSQKIKREDSFHEEDQISPNFRATLKDYRGSGYDRGHMSPNADMPDTASQYDSFSLANMVPQSPKNNQEVWRKLEEATRAMVMKLHQDVYVVTGPIFAGKSLKKIGNGVLVPTATYKAVYYPKTGVIGAYYAPNDDSLNVNVISVCKLEELTGINIFPTLTDTLKRQVYNLPLSTTQVKAGQKIGYLQTDSKSQCAEPITDQALLQSKQTFDPNASLSSQRNPTQKSGWLAKLTSMLATLLEFFSKLLK